MLVKGNPRRAGRASSFLLAAAAVKVIERLESRRLLSSAVTTFAIPNADASTWDGSTAHIVAGPDGNFWFTDPTDNAIGKVTPAGIVTEYPLPVHNVPLDDGSGDSGPDDPEPSDIVVGPNGNLWFTETGVDRIGEITTAGAITEFKTPTADSNPEGIAVGSDGNLWFEESNNESIGRITPDGKITEFSTGSLDVSSIDGLVEGSDGNIWFIADDSDGNGVIATITPAGKITSFPLNDSPESLAAGPDGNLWVGNDDGAIDKVTTAGTVTSYSLPDGAGVTSIRGGLDGNLWFAGDGNNQLGEITAAGAVSEFTLPLDASGNTISINDLVAAVDGTIWYIDANNPEVGQINLGDALLATSLNVNVTAGTSTTSTFASFTDFSGDSDAADYTATLTLGDGSTLAGSIAPNSAGGFDVTAANDWTIGYNNITITITDTRDTARVATASPSVDATAPTATGAGINITATSGELFSGTVATFTGVAANSISQYSATIDWGDGHDTTGTITLNAGGGFDIAGSNRYAASGNYTITTTLSPFGNVFYPGGPVVPSTTPVSTPIVTGVPVSSSGGSGGSNADGPAVSSHTAIIHAIAPTSNLATTPSSSGTNAIVSPVGGDGGATATSSASVAEGVANGTGYSVQATSTAPFTGNVASFSLAEDNADLSHYSATITWNDPGINDWFFSLPNSPSTGVITSSGDGGFTVSTTASFANSGLYHFVVTISDDRLGTGDAAIIAVAYGQIVVGSPIIWLPILQGKTPGALFASADSSSATTAAGSIADSPTLAEHVKPIKISVHMLATQTFTGDVGALSGIKAAAGDLTDLTGTIHWGDGSTSPATFAGGNGKAILIRGSHAYATAGNYAVTVDVTQSLEVNGKPSTLYPLNLPTIESAAKVATPPHHTIIITGGQSITPTAATPFTATLATFTAPAAAPGVTRVATVNWGDGHHSTATITTSSSNELTITGSHIYAKKGRYRINVVVTKTAAPHGGIKVQKLLARIKTMATVE